MPMGRWQGCILSNGTLMLFIFLLNFLCQLMGIGRSLRGTGHYQTKKLEKAFSPLEKHRSLSVAVRSKGCEKSLTYMICRLSFQLTRQSLKQRSKSEPTEKLSPSGSLSSIKSLH